MPLESLLEEELKQLVKMFELEQMGMGSRRKNFTDDEMRENLTQKRLIEHDKGVYYLTVDAERAVRQYLSNKGKR
ncbi:MAG: hypothetical protein ACXAEU_21620 [Candidatus Hodarchaeales archaeon]